MGLAYELFSMQPACFASTDAGKLFRSPLFPRSLLSWALPPRQPFPSGRIRVELHILLQLQLCWLSCSHRQAP